MNIYFHEVSAANYNRYVKEISNCIVKVKPEAKLFYIYDNYDKYKLSIDEDFKKNITIINKWQVQRCVRENKPEAFVCFSFRIPDLYWTLFFNRRSIPTFQVQHGLYIEFFSRSYLSLIKDIKKKFFYLLYLLKIGYSSNDKIATLSATLKKDIKYIQSTDNVDENLLSDHLLIWGDYWKEWFQKRLFYKENTQFHICGSFDFEILKDEKNILKPEEKSITYICQTLVEDGRLNPKYFEKFLDNLWIFIKKSEKKIFIKLHPRSDRSLYHRLENIDKVEITNKFPVSDIYLGHYSTLLSVCAYLKKNILLIEFPGHPIPDLFKKMSNEVINFNDEIIINSNSGGKLKNPEYYYQYIDDPYQKISDVILGNR